MFMINFSFPVDAHGTIESIHSLLLVVLVTSEEMPPTAVRPNRLTQTDPNFIRPKLAGFASHKLPF